MKPWMLSGLTLGLLSFPGLAQEQAPLPLAAPPLPMMAPPCGCIERIRTTYQLHWLEREVPAIKSEKSLREVLTPATKSNLEIEYKPEQQTRTEMVLKPRFCVKEVTICFQKPIATVDPHTGCPTVIYQPVTETKQVTVTTYELVPEEKIVTVRRPCLKTIEMPVVHKTLVLDCKTEAVIRKERFGILVPVETKESQPICAPQP